MKACTICQKVQPLSEFYRHPAMADGHLNQCKTCKRGTANVKYERTSVRTSRLDAREFDGNTEAARLAKLSNDWLRAKL